MVTKISVEVVNLVSCACVNAAKWWCIINSVYGLSKLIKAYTYVCLIS